MPKRVLCNRLACAGMYSLAEISLQGEMSEEGLQPFAADLAARAARRAARTAEQQRQDERDAERAEALSKASAAPSAAELKVRPLGSREYHNAFSKEDPHDRAQKGLMEGATLHLRLEKCSAIEAPSKDFKIVGGLPHSSWSQYLMTLTCAQVNVIPGGPCILRP